MEKLLDRPPSKSLTMRSKELDLSKYTTDKISSSYLDRYDPILEPWVNKKITLLEIGIHEGGSLLLWQDYFLHGNIIGIDIKLPGSFAPQDRVRMFKGNQNDKNFLSEVANITAPSGFDIIIDDASHIGESTKISFWHLFDNHLKDGGLYVIEDWGTGYWDDWPDGMSIYSIRSKISRFLFQIDFTKKKSFHCHSFGMVGFIKELVDEQGAADITRRCYSGKPTRQSKFKNILITPSIVFIKKKAN